MGIPCPIICTDGVKNGNETDIDCGGGTCPACNTGAACALSCDCNGACVTGTCQPLGLSEGDPLRPVAEPTTFTPTAGSPSTPTAMPGRWRHGT